MFYTHENLHQVKKYLFLDLCRYLADNDFEMDSRLLPMLAFVPPHHVVTAFNLGAGGPARKREKKWRDRDERFQRVALSWRDTHVDEQILHVQHPLLIYLRNFAYMNPYPYVDEQ